MVNRLRPAYVVIFSLTGFLVLYYLVEIYIYKLNINSRPIFEDITILEPVESEKSIIGVPTITLYEAGHTYVNSSLCPELGKNVKILILIASAPSQDFARMGIRRTWGFFKVQKNVEIAFVMGSISNITLRGKIDEEQNLYKDIIRGRFVDTYENLTLKTISMLEWVENHCPQAVFVLKTDDDVFVNVPHLITFISKHISPRRRCIYGRVENEGPPNRDINSKHYISEQEYAAQTFPNYISGSAYLFPGRLSKELYAGALRHPYFRLEDVFLTSFLAYDLNITQVHAPQFHNQLIELTRYNVRRLISIHMDRPEVQFEAWKKLHEREEKCNTLKCCNVHRY